MISEECHHNEFYLSFYRDNPNKILKKCQNCNKLISMLNFPDLTPLNYDCNKFHTNVKPSNHDKKIYNIEILEDGTYIYERK